MRAGRLDEMVDFCAGELASGDGARINAIVRRMAQRWESEPALAICFALTSAGAILQEQFAAQEVVAQRAFVLSSLVAADVFALEALGQVPTKGHHLIQFWRRTDPYFLEL